LGRIVPDKRPDVLLGLAATSMMFGDRYFDFKIAGYIPQKDKYSLEYGKKFIEAVDKLENVEYCGFVDNKYDFWKQLDICINPVWETSFDIVFLEAMACGVPILTWDNSAAPYVIGRAGISTKEDISELYNGLMMMYYNVKARKRMSDAGIELIKTKYSLQNFVDSYTNLYRSVAR
jgi:glycosyltransferase involved in cell wall biosynthesis